jgi:hypothetical protein
MKSDEEVIAELKRLSEGLLFISEADYPFEIFYGEASAQISTQSLPGFAGLPADSPVEAATVDDFFKAAVSEPDWKVEQELAVARRYQALLRFLKERLDDVKVYRVGRVNIAVYIIGRTEAGNWLGLSTRVVET